MRARLRIAVRLAAFASAATPAHAGPVPVAAELAVQIATLPPVVMSGNGVATVNGSGGGGHLDSLGVAAGIAATAGFVMPVTDPAATPIQGFQLTAQNGTGTFGPTGTGGFGGTMPILGVAKVCLFAPCTTPPPANLSMPLTAVGVGGSKVATFLVNITVFGAPWTTGTAAVGVVTRMGFAHGPASGTSSTAAPSGVVRLVTPIFLTTNIGASAVIPAFASFTMHFVPEPGTLLLLGSGTALLALAGGRRAPR